MSSNYKIRELRVELRPGVVLVADIDSVDAASKLLKELQDAKLVTTVHTTEERQRGTKDSARDTEDPASRLEIRAGLPSGSLASRNIVAFKDNVPQLLRSNIFEAVSDAALVLLFAIEGGLQTTSIDYESFKGLYDSQNIKSGSPLTMLLTNLRNAGYLDKKAYTADRTLRLTAKGDKKAGEVLKELVSKSG